jgi:purine-binding chemotaxis protein CheW
MSVSVDHLTRKLEESGGEAAEKRQFVTFALGKQLFCVDIMSVREIRISNVITPLPGAPDFVRGVINLRGTIVPICDLRMRFGEGKTELAGSYSVVIVSIADRWVGLLVDEVCDILTADNSEMSPIPETDANRRNPFFHGLITQGDTMLIVVALDKLIDNFAPGAAAA